MAAVTAENGSPVAGASANGLSAKDSPDPPQDADMPMDYSNPGKGNPLHLLSSVAATVRTSAPSPSGQRALVKAEPTFSPGPTATSASQLPLSEVARNLMLASEMSASRILSMASAQNLHTTSSPLFHSPPVTVNNGVNPGVCSLHPDGKTNGVECPKCDIILGSSRSLGGHMTMMHSRNSCKTLKCPKCNWHYKYQETLEIHMKEKHPDTEVTCVYCLTNQPHPRLARGETYSCGYKPYRCDICKYSTTTKGNLSIHMQSDKHLNNVQEIQQGKIVADPTAVVVPQSPQSLPTSQSPLPTALTPSGIPSGSGSVAPGRKPSWRCEICNYETNVARNLRIHWTSEKHHHNMMMVQQNAKHLHHVAGYTAGLPPPVPDLYHPTWQEDQTATQAILHNSIMCPLRESCKLYSCCVCAVFTCDSLDELTAHVQADRSQPQDSDVTILGGYYHCNLCSYRTHLKANFQLHTKTDKHVQRLQLVNHIRAGGPANDWRIQYLTANNTVQLKCNACNEYASSLHKLELHRSSLRHELYAKAFEALQQRSLPSEKHYFYCNLCSYATQKRINLMHHLHSARHSESVTAALGTSPDGQLDAQGWLVVREGSSPDPDLDNETTNDSVSKSDDEESGSLSTAGDDAAFCCSGCDFTCGRLSELKGHVCDNSGSTVCALCQASFASEDALKLHISKAHRVSDGDVIEKLKMLLPADSVNPPLLGQPATPSGLKKEPDGTSDNPGSVPDASLTCSVCRASFPTLDALCIHQIATGHVEQKETPSGAAYLCWRKGCNQYFKSIQAMQLHYREIHARAGNNNEPTAMDFCCATSEKHAYKYRCTQCSLAFRTEDKLRYHHQYHVMRNATKCKSCGRSFRTVESLQKHIQQTHGSLPQNQLGPPMLPPAAVQSAKSSPALSHANYESLAASPSISASPDLPDRHQEAESLDEETLRSLTAIEGSYGDPSKKFKCHRCKVGYSRQIYLTAHNKTLFHRRGEKNVLNVDKFNDPSRPFKCEPCRESFTQRNMLIGHNNSLLHLNQCKRLGLQPDIVSGHAESKPAGKSDEKRYKCNICKVQQNQSTTLDIHLRSVYHQNRMMKLPELIAHGEVDPAKPYIEVPGSESQKYGKEFQDFLSQLEASSAAMAQQQSAAAFMSLASMSLSPFVSPTAGFLPGLPPMFTPLPCPTCRIPFPSRESLEAHQKTCTTASGHDLQGSELCGSGGSAKCSNVNVPSSKGVCENLLKTYGFELVMQYNEMQHRKRPKALPPATALEPPEENEGETPEKKPKTESEEDVSKLPTPADPTTDKVEDKPPEISESTCTECGRKFSSVWVLKAHVEEIHRSLVPLESIEKVAETIKTLFGKKKAEVPDSSTTKVNPLPAARKENPAIGENMDTLEIQTSKSSKVTPQIPKVAPTPVTTPAPPKLPTSSQGNKYQGAVDPFAAFNQGFPFMGMPFGNPFTNPFQQPFMPMFMPDPFGLAALSGLQPGNMAMAQLAAAASAATSGTSAPQSIKSERCEPHMSDLPPITTTTSSRSAMCQPSPSPSVSTAAGNPALSAVALMAQAQAQFAANQNKRARTRITDEQLKVLREYFDINNSPSEAQIKEMSMKSGLPEKVIKHWFRNTLFKERQKNKDSPYNFNVPPSMGIDLEQYEKTGEAKIIPYKPEIEPTVSTSNPIVTTPKGQSSLAVAIKKEPCATPEKETKPKIETISANNVSTVTKSTSATSAFQQQQKATAAALSNIQASLAFNSLNAQDALRQLSQLPPVHTGAAFPGSAFANPFLGLLSPPGGKLPLGQPSSISPQSSSGGSNNGDFNNFLQVAMSPATSSNSQPGRRANRTRFTDDQVRVLQEFFEQNAYPKDEDTEHLSKRLNLNPRVIVVWFQNARQKAKKLYETAAPPNGTETSGGEEIASERVVRTPGQNFKCRKCDLVFQRYYELMKHQQAVCYKNEEEAQQQQLMQLSIEQPHCDPCNLDFSDLQQFEEHRKLHMTNPGLFSRHPVDGGSGSDSGSPGPGAKRQRTQILPEQLEFLYEMYAQEANPSSKMLDEIAVQVGLGKRVVQVWFQNTRARDRKGQLSNSTHATLHFNKRCPCCGILFHSRSTLENHLATRHSDQASRLEINIDRLPDAEEVPSFLATLPPGVPSSLSSPGANPVTSGANPPLSLESFLPTGLPQATLSSEALRSMAEMQSKIPASVAESTREGINEWLAKMAGIKTSDLPRLAEAQPSGTNFAACDNTTASQDDTESEFAIDDDSLSSVAQDSPPGMSPQGSFNRAMLAMGGGAMGGSMGLMGGPQKRHRTHMAPIQIKVMKELFKDYKTPTMTECELLGRELGLGKRVVQVWFQNARAKERRAKAASSPGCSDVSPTGSTTSVVTEFKPLPVGCNLCSVVYSATCSLQDHLFSSAHIDMVRATIKGKDGVKDTVKPSVNPAALEKIAGAKPGQGKSYGNLANQSYAFSAGFNFPGLPASPFTYNPSLHGTMVSMLQIPHSIMERISAALGDPEGQPSVTFSQDGLSLADVTQKLDDERAKENVKIVSQEVGWACRTCQTVFPSQAMFRHHVAIVCHSTLPPFVLVQNHYHCSVCRTNLGTVEEYTAHIAKSEHAAKWSKNT